jgi:hypothetical protein
MQPSITDGRIQYNSKIVIIEENHTNSSSQVNRSSEQRQSSNDEAN